MKNLVTYRVIARNEPEGGYTVFVPSLPGCISYGETLDEAKANIKEAIELYIESLISHNENVPSDEDTIEFNLSIAS